MKRILCFVIACVFMISLHAQTEKPKQKTQKPQPQQPHPQPQQGQQPMPPGAPPMQGQQPGQGAHAGGPNGQRPEGRAPLRLSPRVKMGKLPNGLTYFIMNNQRPKNRMELRLVVNVGSTMENNSQQGLAHFVEHMAFNGTKHFKKNELVDYLESIGTKFGPHLNAYTSFDETVYMMQVPTDSAIQMENAFLIMEDWAGGLTFDPKEVDKERGVVIEEWRLGQGASERMRNKYWPRLFKGSHYAARLPIGKKEIIESAPYDTIVSFYKDWYRPDLMAVVAVGDFEPEMIEEKIKSHFGKLVNPVNERPLQTWEVPDVHLLDVVSATDKEAPYTLIEMIYKLPHEDIKTLNDYRQKMIYDLFTGMMSARLEEITNQPDPPFTYAYSYYGDLVRTKNSYTSLAIVKDKDIDKGMEALVAENQRVKRFGFTFPEMERQKKQMMREMEKRMSEMEKTESSRHVSKIVDYFLEEKPVLDPMREMEIYHRYLDGIQLDEINEVGRTWITEQGRNCTVIIESPEKEKAPPVDEMKYKQQFEKAEKKDLQPYADMMPSSELLKQKPVEGKIVSEKHNDEFDYTELKLSNGATVVYKATDFKNDEVQFRATSWGGSSLYPASDDISASEAGSIMEKSGLGDFNKNQLDKYLKGRIVSVWPYITETSENMYGNSGARDLETLMQLIYMYFTSPRKDSIGFAAYMEQQKSFIENRKLSPENAYRDTIQVTMAGYNPRRAAWTMSLLNKVNQQKAYTIFRERFSNAADFTFYFVGSVNDEEMKRLAKEYIAALPSSEKTETWKDVGINTPKGTVKKTVKKGIAPKSMVTMKFTGDAVYTPKENMDMKSLVKLLNIKLREVLREEKSGTYGVQCYGYISRIPKQEYEVSIQFGCAPENASSLTKDALEVLKSIASSGCDDKDLVKIKETFRREREVNLRENNWWINSLTQKYTMNDNLPSQKELDEYLQNLSSGELKKAAQKYLDQTNYAYFVLLPENQ